MITEEEVHLEEVANLQIKAMHEVLDELLKSSKVVTLPKLFYWFNNVDYASVDKYGCLELWSRGYGNDPDTVISFDFKTDEQLLKDKNIDNFKQRFRKEQLPLFNKKRKELIELNHRNLLNSEKLIKELTGDIE